ncbi:hypothetical protein D8674_020639 [Pyrus ussuriensis x Pyrus communis]|uniref:Uncharacterized protein n=1 Tax=Pyrus ussuriensis x Pyrus communis TaxID=2448454 RepID=A0A5N5HLC7_9ROSA|nr:hypothetical protein D8674_020639 [Pyrus ussuriensis x Pyrus communis]
MQVIKKIRRKTFAKKPTMEKKKTPMYKKKTSTGKKKIYRSIYLQYRCNMTGFSDSMEIDKPMLEDHIDSLIKLYIDHFLVVTKRKKKFGIDLIKIINCYDPKEQKFRFGDLDARGITPNDVALIFGLNNDGGKLPNVDKSSKYAYKKSLIDQTPKGARDTTSIICAHLIQSLLFVNSGSYITWNFVQICGKLEEMSKYNWAKRIRNYLFQMIDKSQIKKKKEGDETVLLNKGQTNANPISSTEKGEEFSKKGKEKTVTRKRKRIAAEKDVMEHD